MKMKTMFFCVAAFLITREVKAQGSTGQLRAGVNLANISITDNGRINKANELTSFQLGFIGDIHLGSIAYLQPGILFTGKGAKTEAGDENSATYRKATTNPYYIEVPANIVVKLPMGPAGKIFFGAGPYIAVGISGKNKIDGRVANVAYHSEKDIQFSNDDPTTFNQQEGAGYGIMRRFDYGLNGTAGIEGKSIVLGINYGLGLAKLQSTANSISSDNDKHRVLSFTIGFKL